MIKYKREGEIIRQKRIWYPGATYHAMARGIRYASYYNQRYGYHGHVFEGRFKSCIVKDDSYFLQTSRYIHMNPVKAKITAHPEDYPWSSYRTILRMTNDRIIQPEKTLAFFKQSIFYYREFVEDATHKYKINENMIQKEIGEDETWLPW